MTQDYVLSIPKVYSFCSDCCRNHSLSVRRYFQMFYSCPAADNNLATHDRDPLTEFFKVIDEAQKLDAGRVLPKPLDPDRQAN